MENLARVASPHALLLDLWREHEPTVVMVTHDVDEAVTLSDRVMVMRPRPGRVQETLGIDLPRPRDKLSTDFDAATRTLLHAIDRSLAADQPPPTATGRSPSV